MNKLKKDKEQNEMGKWIYLKWNKQPLPLNIIIQKDLATTNTFKYNIYRHTTKTYKTHIHGHNNLIITALIFSS